MDEGHQQRSRRRLTATVTDLTVERQRALLVGLVTRDRSIDEAEASMRELERLTDTAGSDPVETVIQRRDAPDPAYFIGSGKARELASLGTALDIDLVVFDNPLTPAQQRNLQDLFEVDVVDREALILDIFAQHATSKAGMLQVELALLRYRLPRLRGKGTELSRLGGGIGTRGPGESQLETDRRRIQERITKLDRDLADLARSRATQRKQRSRTHLPMLSLVGYTNAGKSTLLNSLTGAGVLVEDQLFSTLDSTVRKLQLPGGQEVLVSDTVGFVRNLPHQLVEAFRSTLEEARDADLLLHIVDGTEATAERQIAAVREVLEEIDAAGATELLVLNKQDIADPVVYERLRMLHPDAVPISAADGSGLEHLLEAIVKALAATSTEVTLLVPYDRGDVVAAVHRRGEVAATSHVSAGTQLTVFLPNDAVGEFRDFIAP